jgi:hypothetical protein
LFVRAKDLLLSAAGDYVGLHDSSSGRSVRDQGRDDIVRTLRDLRDTAIEAARFLDQRNPNAKIVISDLRDGSNVSD